MSHVLVESDSWVESITEPDILDTDYPATVPAAFTVLANRTRRLAITLGQDTSTTSPTESVPEGSVLSPDLDGSQPFLVPTMGRADWFRGDLLQIAGKIVGLRKRMNTRAHGTATYVESAMGNAMITSPAKWAADYGASVPAYAQTDTTFPYALDLMLPNWQRFSTDTPESIIQISVITGKLVGSHSALPDTKLTISLCYTDYTTFPATTVIVPSSTLIDPAANITQYDTQHYLIVSLAAGVAPVSGARNYFIRVAGESGSNSLAGQGVIAAHAIYWIY